MTDRSIRILSWLALSFLLVILIDALKVVLTPFVAAAFFAYLGSPWVATLQRRGLSRRWAASAVFALLLSAVLLLSLLLLPAVTAQLDRLVAALPHYVAWLQQQLLPLLREFFGAEATVDLLEHLKQGLSENWREAGGSMAMLLAQLTQSSLAIVGSLFSLALVPLVGFYLLRDWDIFIAHMAALLPLSQRDKAVDLARQCDQVLGAFLRGQLSIMALLVLFYAVGMMWVGLDLALLLGLLAGLASVVPYLGVVVGVLAAGIAAMVQFHDWSYLLSVLAVFGLGQLLEGMLLTPLLIGDRIGLHPVAVIFFVLAGGQLFGFVGVLLALPVAAVAMVLLRHLHGNYINSALYHDQQHSVE